MPQANLHGHVPLNLESGVFSHSRTATSSIRSALSQSTKETMPGVLSRITIPKEGNIILPATKGKDGIGVMPMEKETKRLHMTAHMVRVNQTSKGSFETLIPSVDFKPLYTCPDLIQSPHVLGSSSPKSRKDLLHSCIKQNDEQFPFQTTTTTPATRAIPSRTTTGPTAAPRRPAAARTGAATSWTGISRWTAALRRRGRSANIMLARTTLKVRTLCRLFSSIDFPILQWAVWNIMLPIL